MTRKFAVITGTRADYGHLYWLMKELDDDPEIELLVIVTGAHLSSKYGRTVDQIEADGFNIIERVSIQLDEDDGVAIAKSVALATIGLAEAIERHAPEVVILLGDRFEELAAAQAALFVGVPVAHLHGGETSEGAIDESIRHAVTKLSHLHFVAADDYRKRVLQLGENPKNVFNCGAPGLDHLARTPSIPRDDLLNGLGISQIERPYMMVTHHPQTIIDGQEDISQLIDALAQFTSHNIIMTGVNADPGNVDIRAKLEGFCAMNKDRAYMFDSLGQKRYLSAIRYADCVVGNSSSGLIETPALNTPTVNIGDRQGGRLKAISVIDCALETSSIVDAINTAISKTFQESIQGPVSLYGIGDTAGKIKEHLKSADLSNIKRKSFFDV